MSSIKIYKDENYDFGDCDLSFDKNSYIVSINNKIIGYFRLSVYDSKTVLLDYELIKKYQKKGIGNYFYKIIEKYIINNFDFERIILMIRFDNKASTKIADEHSYFIDYSLTEENEMHNFNAYVKSIKR